VYGHASELKVARGEKVKRGQEIATSGMSGSADSPKLHFEVRKNSSPVDPKTFLE
ncbi:M23 family metallopeptidase, partial [Rhizobiaceae sp. 2RAB30]